MNMNAFRMPEWYQKLSEDCFPTVFVELNLPELEALQQGDTESDAVKEFLPELTRVMSLLSHRLPTPCWPTGPDPSSEAHCP